MDHMDSNSDHGYLRDAGEVDYAGDQGLQGDLSWAGLDPNHFTANAAFDTQSYQYAEPHQVNNSPYGNYGFQQSSFLQQDYTTPSSVYQQISRPSPSYGSLPYNSSMALNSSMNGHGYPATDDSFDNLYNSQPVESATISPHALDRYDARRNDNLGVSLQSRTQRAEEDPHANLISFREPWRQDFGQPHNSQLQSSMGVRAEVAQSRQTVQPRTLDPDQPPTTSWSSTSTTIARPNVANKKRPGDNTAHDSKSTVRITHPKLLAELAHNNVQNNLTSDRNPAPQNRGTAVPYAPFLAFSGLPVELDIKGKSISFLKFT